MTNETEILKVGAEGGYIALVGRKQADAPLEFRLQVNETALDDLLLPEDRACIDLDPEEWVNSWDAAMSLLDRYLWTRLHPTRVHPDFMTRVLSEVEHRGGAEEVKRWQTLLVEREERMRR